MKHRSRLLAGLFVLTFASVACFPETVRVTPAPSTAAPGTVAPTPSASATRTATPAPTTAAPTATATPPPTPSQAPGSTPATACPKQTRAADAPGNRVLLTAIRVAHNPGFDRVVFEFSPTDQGVGTYGMPGYTIEVASTFAGPSGIPVTVAGNAAFRVLFPFGTTDAHTKDGKPTLASQDLKPTTPLVKEVRLVEDFEATVQIAVGLDHLVCPTVLTLANPVRVVLDFPTPP